MDPELRPGASPYDPAMLPELYVVNFAELEHTTKEDPFVREAFELLKKASVLLIAVAGIRTEGPRLVFEKLRLSPGDRLLDVGCGWGGRVRHAARRGIRVTGVTLSEEQATWAQRATADEGLGELAEVRNGDTATSATSGSTPRRRSGCSSTSGCATTRSTSAFLQSRLRTGGLLLNHCITRPDNTSEPSTHGFIDRYVFPDGELTGSGRIISEAQDAGLEVLREENLRPRYAMTLRDWCANLVEHWDEAVDEVGLPTAKVWGLYMAGPRVRSERGGIQLHQVLAVEPDDRGGVGDLPLRPWWTP
ncbi:class I SAM-dependent methyltransferase [Agromyces tardus]|nr:class I SAM-dependent methyltransferase [Agromyces tardus]